VKFGANLNGEGKPTNFPFEDTEALKANKENLIRYILLAAGKKLNSKRPKTTETMMNKREKEITEKNIHLTNLRPSSSAG